MVTALAGVRARLAGAGIEDAAFEAAQLYTLATGRDAYLADDAPLSPVEQERLCALCAKRCTRYPLQYLCGAWDFMDLTLKIGPGVLIPRADTEVVAMAAIEAARAAGAAETAGTAGAGGTGEAAAMTKKGPAVADLCSGSGAIALAVARHVPHARVTAVEISPHALTFLRANNNTYGGPLHIVWGDVFFWQNECAPESLDVIVSNPPYIAPEEFASLAPELAHEPRIALEAAEGGLRFYRHIAPAYFPALRPGGWLIFEIGYRQADAVTALCRDAGYTSVSVRRDAGGNPRCVLARRPHKEHAGGPSLREDAGSPPAQGTLWAVLPCGRMQGRRPFANAGEVGYNRKEDAPEEF